MVSRAIKDRQMISRKRRVRLSFHRWLSVFFVSTVLLVGLGTLFIFDLSLVESARTFSDPYQLLRLHLSGVGISVILFVITFAIPSHWWLKIALPLYGISLLALVLVLIPGIGLELNGARSWLAIGLLRFQPVEFFKFSMILYFSTWLLNKPSTITLLMLLAPAVLLLLLQPDVGSLAVVLLIAGALFFLAGGALRSLLSLGLLIIPVLVVLVLIAPYRLQRITAFLNPESDPQGTSFHIRQMTLALGRGGLFGQGLGNSNQKFAYIPEASTDSIFALIAEEVGFFGSAAIILLFLVFFYSGYKISASYTESKELQLVAYGLLGWLALQTLINLATVVALLPMTGVPLPFFSYGRSAQVMTIMSIALVARLGITKK